MTMSTHRSKTRRHPSGPASSTSSAGPQGALQTTVTANHRFCREHLGADSLIPAKKRRSAEVVATTPYRRETVRRLGGPGDETSRRTYRQRWKAETIMSVVKRRWGETLSARLDVTQEAQALLRGVVHDLNRLVRLGCAA
jgi:hypothetical protein